MNDPNGNKRAPEKRPLEERPLPRRHEPLVDKELEKRIDELLRSKMKGNGDLDVLKGSYAIDANLRNSAQLNTKRKLALAAVLSLVADSVDPQKRENLTPIRIAEARSALEGAINVGVGQMLRRLRPIEETANELLIWKENSLHASSSQLPENHTTVLMAPQKIGAGTSLDSSEFHRMLDAVLQQSNNKIGRNLYRAFLMLPVNELAGESASLIPYLRIANRLQVHVFGSVPLKDDKASLKEVHQAWKYKLSDVPSAEQDILADATLVANRATLREGYADYHEEEPLTCGLHYAFAGHMSQYFSGKKIGDWYLPILYPQRRPESLATQNTILTRTNLQDTVAESRLNLAYYVPPKEDPDSPGVKIYGPMTVFPANELDKEDRASHVDRIQSQARVTRNRIGFYLLTQLERFVGGNYSEYEVRREVNAYLESMRKAKQIESFLITNCEKSTGTGHFEIALNIQWNTFAESFDISMDSSQAQPGEEPAL